MKSSIATVAIWQFLMNTLRAQSVVTFPNAGGPTDLGNYAAYLVGEDPAKTTYHLQRAPETASCDIYTETFTIVAGPSTWGFELDSPGYSVRTACTFTGSPSVTTGTCTYTQSDLLDSRMSGASTRTLPRTWTVGTEPREEPPLWHIEYLSMTVYGSTDARPASASATATQEIDAGATATTVTTGSGGAKNSSGSAAPAQTGAAAERLNALVGAGLVAGAAAFAAI